MAIKIKYRHSEAMKKRLSDMKKDKPIKGWKIDSLGYKMIFLPNHPNATKAKYVYEHRLVMEKHLKRHLLPTEVIHHKDGVRSNNTLENLQLFESQAKHANFHRTTGGNHGN